MVPLPWKLRATLLVEGSVKRVTVNHQHCEGGWVGARTKRFHKQQIEKKMKKEKEIC